MIITLVGMSGAGKTHWSKELEKKSFKRFGCDDLLEKKLNGNFSGIKSVAEWMGRPSDKNYRKRCREYLACEQKALEDILTEIAKCTENVVIDTTGSVIYLDKKILKKLKALTKIVYLEIPPAYYQKMEQKYFADPKPVIWGNFKTYHDLLIFRARRYQKLADTVINYADLCRSGFGVSGFLKKAGEFKDA